ncbi:MAG: ribose-5-phosphate isomerase [Nanoarchaeota archaeon]
MEKEIIYLAADHAGFEAKKRIIGYLNQRNIEFVDLGAHKYKNDDDYPDYAFKVAEKVAKHKKAKGILICGTGAGMAIAANKVKGIRAVEAYDKYSAKMSRLHNDANILTLRARNVLPGKMLKIVDAWLNTEFSVEERHDRRIRKIMHYENKR